MKDWDEFEDLIDEANELFENCLLEDAKELLSIEAGLNPNQDNLLRGLIQAYREMQDFRMDDLEEVVA